MTLKPFLKWAGGKRQLLPDIRAHMPKGYDLADHTYFEPFIGAAAVLLDFQPKKAVFNDANAELVNCYNVIKNEVDELVAELKKHKEKDSKDYYFETRNIDRDSEAYGKLTDAQRAARVIYMNKTCFNGLYRVNSKGQFNVPYANLKNPAILDEETLRGIHAYLSENDVEAKLGSFEHAVKGAKAGDFVYFDPPYDPLSETSSFTSYAKDSFGKAEQEKLRDLFKELSEKGCFVMLSNSRTPFIEELYKEFHIHIVKAKRNINAKGDGRGEIDEVLVTNYKVEK